MPEQGQTGDKSILVVDDDTTLRRLLVRQVDRLGFHAAGAGTLAEALAAMETDQPDLILLDQQLPDAAGVEHLPELAQRCPVIVLTAHGSVNQAVDAVKAGAEDYLTKPISPQMLELALEKAFHAARLRDEVGLLRREACRQEEAELIGRTPQIEALRARATMLAETDTPVLVQGEFGAGKRTVARFIHNAGPRALAGFAEVQCARVEGGHLLDELFGAQEPGLLELVRGGTLFLSDIGRMPELVQRRLATTLETRQFQRRGSTRQLPLQARVIAGTSQSTAELVADNALVPELYYQLTAFTLDIPPLRDRRADIPRLAEHFLARRRFALSDEKTFSKKMIDHLKAWDWPGNLRELRNVVERGVILSGASKTMRPEHVELGEQLTYGAAQSTQIGVDDEPSLDALRDRYIDILLHRHDRNRRAVAAILGISERSLYRILSKSRTHTD